VLEADAAADIAQSLRCAMSEEPSLRCQADEVQRLELRQQHDEPRGVRTRKKVS
jgi:hypothetical protein